MNSKEVIKYGLILVGAYLVYRYVQDHGGIGGLLGTGTIAGATPVSVQPGHVTTPATTTPTPTPTSTPAGPSLKDRVSAAAGAGDKNIDEWCWFFMNQSGKACPDPDAAWPGVDRTQPIGIDQFWSLLQSAGMGFVAPAYQQTYPSWLM